MSPVCAVGRVGLCRTTCSSELEIFHFAEKIEAQQFYSRCEETSSHLANYPGSTVRQDQQFAYGRFMNFGENMA